MGCFGNSSKQNPFIGQNQQQILIAIKSCPPQTLAYYLYQYLDVKLTQKYFTIVMNFYDHLNKSEIENINQVIDVGRNKQKIKTRQGNINYHMQYILRNIRLADEVIKKLQNQLKTTKKQLKEKRTDWVFTAGRIIQNSRKPKIISQIVYNGNQTPMMMNEQRVNQKIKQCQQKIRQSITQKDIQENEKVDLVMTNVNQLNAIIAKYQNQVEEMKQKLLVSNEKIKQLKVSGNLSLQEWQKKNNKLQKINEQLKQKYDNLQNQNMKLIQENNRLNSVMDRIYKDKQSVITDRRTTFPNYNKLQQQQQTSQKVIQFIKAKGGSQLKKNEKLQQQFQKTTSLKQMTNIQTQIDLQSQTVKRSDTNLSMQFKKFPHSLIINNIDRGFRGSRNYKQLIDQIFAPIKIHSSFPLFFFDKVRPNNMNQYINKENNLLFLAQLKNGTILGGFSRFGFKESPQNLIQNICFIFSIHSPEKYYKLQLKEQSMAKYSVKLDNNFLKIGDNEIRITCGKNEGFSNVGSSSSIFENKHKKVNVHQFLNMKQDKFELVNYEIYCLNLDYPEELLQRCKNALLYSTIDEP